MATLKHAPGPECPSCSSKLEDAHPFFKQWFYEFVRPRFPDMHISWTFRSRNEQDRMVRDGKSKAPWPRSKHNALDKYGNPNARAVDLFTLVQNKAAFPISTYKVLADECEAESIPIRWGGTFKSIRDYDHFELLDSVV